MSPLSNLRSTAVVLFLGWKIAAAPQRVAQPVLFNSSSPIPVLDTLSTDKDTLIYQDSSFTNASTAAAGSNDDDRDIFCLKGHTKRDITVESCRPTLNYLKQFPDYTFRQSFLISAPQPGRTSTGTPRLPHIYGGVVMPDGPPFEIVTEDGDCVIKVQVDNGSGFEWGIEGKFSWRDVRATATRIIEHCDDVREGQGGLTKIGFPERPLRAPGWIVIAVGKPWASPLGNVSVVNGNGSIGVITGQQALPVDTE